MTMILRLAHAGVRLGFRIVYLRYVMASALALAVDMGLFLLLIGSGTPPTAASVLGYSTGILVHWLLSSRAVFTEARAHGPSGQHRQRLLFLLSAFLGLGLTALIVGGFQYFGLDPRLGKMAAIIVSFQVVWLLRRHVVFAS